MKEARSDAGFFCFFFTVNEVFCRL